MSRPQLKLVPPAPPAPGHAMKRPYATLYFASSRDRDEQSYIRKGHAASEHGAIRASVVRVFLGEAAKAMIFEHGVLIYTIVRVRSGIHIHFGRA